MSVPDQLWQENERALIWHATKIRPDWTRDEVWEAIYAAQTAGLPWPEIVLGLFKIAFREDTTPTRPRELVDATRGLRAQQRETGVPASGHEAYQAMKAARGWVATTGEQPAVREAG